MKVYTLSYRTNGPAAIRGILSCLIESPSEKEGKSFAGWVWFSLRAGLNESPSKKEGKFSAS